MHKISEIISKPVFTLYEGINIGTVKSFLYNEKTKKIKGFFIFDDETETHDHFILSSKIFSIGENCLIVKNMKAMTPQIDMEDNGIINSPAISVDGLSLGKISDVYFDDKYDIKAFLTTKNIVVPSEKLINFGRDAMIFDFKESPLKVARFKTQNRIAVLDLPEIKVSILDTKQKSEIISNNFKQSDFNSDNKIESQTNVKQDVVLPKKLVAKPETIIGKRANKTIYGLNGEVVVKDMQVITDKIYERAKKHSKLFELKNSVE